MPLLLCVTQMHRTAPWISNGASKTPATSLGRSKRRRKNSRGVFLFFFSVSHLVPESPRFLFPFLLLFPPSYAHATQPETDPTWIKGEEEENKTKRNIIQHPGAGICRFPVSVIEAVALQKKGHAKEMSCIFLWFKDSENYLWRHGRVIFRENLVKLFNDTCIDAYSDGLNVISFWVGGQLRWPS